MALKAGSSRGSSLQVSAVAGCAVGFRTAQAAFVADASLLNRVVGRRISARSRGRRGGAAAHPGGHYQCSQHDFYMVNFHSCFPSFIVRSSVKKGMGARSYSKDVQSNSWVSRLAMILRNTSSGHLRTPSTMRRSCLMLIPNSLPFSCR